MKLAFDDSASSADAAVSWSRPTSRGTEASSDGRCSAASPIIAAAAPNSGHACGCGSDALATSTAAQQHRPASHHLIRRLRSSRSASAPPYRPNTTSGTSSATPSSPTAVADPVSCRAWTSSATAVAWLPNSVTVRLAKTSRKSRDERSGVRSAPSRRMPARSVRLRGFPVILVSSTCSRRAKALRTPESGDDGGISRGGKPLRHDVQAYARRAWRIDCRSRVRPPYGGPERRARPPARPAAARRPDAGGLRWSTDW